MHAHVLFVNVHQ